jgi:predicted permease
MLHLEIGGSSHSPMRAYRFVREAGIFAGLAGENEEQESNWRHGDTVDRLFVVRVTGNFFAVTGIPVAMGRPLQPGESDTVVISYRFWRHRLQSDPNAIGRKLVLDGGVFTVAGILPPDHRTVTGFGFAPDLYMPVTREETIVALYARMPEGMTPQIARERLKAVCDAFDKTYPDGNHHWAKGIRVAAIAGIERLTGEEMLSSVAAFAGVLMAVVGLVLLIACANVASLLLARASSRSHELAVRLAIGAGRGRIIRQLLAESLLLALLGATAGLALNLALMWLLGRVALPLPIPIRLVIQPDWRLLLYSAVLAVGCTLAAGLVPAIRATRAAIGATLQREEHQVGRSQWTLRNALVAGQLVVSIVLLSAGYLFLRNMVNASAMSPGFDLQHTVWASMRLVPEQYPQSAKIAALRGAALERLRTLPGVEAASVMRVMPLNGNITNGTDVTTDLAARPIHVQFHTNYVASDYFRAMGIPILHGREFLPSDRAGAPKVAVVNENLARRLYGDVNPIGHTIRSDFGLLQIVGVANNSRYFTLGEEGELAFYAPYEQSGKGAVNLEFVVRAAGSPESVLSAVQGALGALDRTAALEVKPLRNGLAFALLPSRVGAILLGAAGLLGLVLASIGLYGVLLYAVSRRTREIGLRVALGASPVGILRLVLRQSLAILTVGLAIGIALSIFAVRPLAMFLSPAVRPSDPWNFFVVAAVLCVVGLAATISPAVRAIRVDPVVALRHE